MTEVRHPELQGPGEGPGSPRPAQPPINPRTDPITWPAFNARLLARRAPLRTLLRDETFILDISAPLADEILWGSGLRFDRQSHELSSQEVRRLYRAVRELPAELDEILAGAVAAEAASDDDDEDDEDISPSAPVSTSTSASSRSAQASGPGVHGRAGQPCRRCRTPLVQQQLADGEDTVFCPKCQS
jgi:formamidopyrimidine-DNA glycosylase